MNKIIENFNQAAKNYESLALPQAALAAQLAKWVLPDERKGCALELGAGTGLFTRHLQPWTGIYTATDAGPKMVAQGRLHCPEAVWKVLDARGPNGTAPMDWIFACSLLQWLSEPQAILENWRKILGPGGQIAVAVLLPGTLGELLSLLPEAKPLEWRQIGEWRKLLEAAGFRIEREQTWEQPSFHANGLELLRAVHAMGLAPRQAVGPGRLRRAVHDYNKNHADPGVGVRATWRAWMVRAKVR